MCTSRCLVICRSVRSSSHAAIVRLCCGAACGYRRCAVIVPLPSCPERRFTYVLCLQSIKWAHRMLWVDLVLYVVFLLTFLLAALAPFVSVAWDGHMLINIFSKYANTLEWPDPSNTFQDIHSVADFWSWWRGPFR